MEGGFLCIPNTHYTLTLEALCNYPVIARIIIARKQLLAPNNPPRGIPFFPYIFMGNFDGETPLIVKKRRFFVAKRRFRSVLPSGNTLSNDV